MELHVNGRPAQLQPRSASLLIEVLRDQLKLTGTNHGCDTAQCGACTVVMNGRAVKSCNVLALQVCGANVETVEGLAEGVAEGKQLHALQEAFSRHHALQCGFCTPGMLMRAVAMQREGVPAEPEAVRRALAGNLCRCTGYEGIVAAICEWLASAQGGGRDAGL
ncbi:(2Fe-2S)-binding protein [Paucibacter sp. AS339]|uniref:(2Fe-2S)-binding protein n=1 Tax=Paucibacter hankyongi TaxID=3133434 RepID=UPI0030A8C079